MARQSSIGLSLTKSAYARHRGVSPAMVTHWLKGGRIAVTEAGLVDVHASDKMLAGSLDPSRGGKGGKSDRMPAGPSAAPAAKPAAAASAPLTDTYTRVRTHREAFVAKSAEAVYRKMMGELVERDEYNRGLVANIGPTLQRLDTIDARLAARLAAESDVRKCGDMLRDEAMSIRQEVADYAQALIDGAGKARQ